MRICIIAGADRNGKSTLCDEFVKNGWEYVHFTPPKGSPYEEYSSYIREVLTDPVNKDENFVIDRYMYCEFAYSKHYGRKTDMTINNMLGLEREILDLDPSATVVYCETDIDSNWKRIEEEGKHEFKNKEQLAMLRNTYHSVLGKSELNVIRYDFTDGDTPEGIYNDVISM